MKSRQFWPGTFATIAVLLGTTSPLWSQPTGSSIPSAAPSAPPVAPVRAVTDDYYGTKVVDPYRYMENLEDPSVQAWFRGQNDYARVSAAKEVRPLRQVTWPGGLRPRVGGRVISGYWWRIVPVRLVA